MSNIKTEELDSPLAGRVSVVGGSEPTAGHGGGKQQQQEGVQQEHQGQWRG
jgi:hypothetical protein